MDTAAKANVLETSITPLEDAGLLLSLRGRLDATTLPDVWTRAVLPVRKSPPRNIQIDAAELTYCDGAGLGLFAELRRIMAEAGGEVRVQGASRQLQSMLDMSRLVDPMAGQLKPLPVPSMAAQVGQSTVNLFHDMRALVAFVGQVTSALAWVAAHPRKVRLHDLLHQADKTGTAALPVISLLGFLIGLILAFQCAGPLQQFGAQDLIPTLVGIAVVKEFGPLITGIILAGRSGSAFAAEIGTMKVTEELNALQTMGLDPIRFLVAPRVLAAVIVTPALVIYNMLCAFVGGYVMMASLGYSLRFYVNQLESSLTYVDLLAGVFKAFVFAVIVAAIGCQRGIATRSGPGAVGDSTTRAVVAGIVLIIFADAILGVVYFMLHI